MVCRAIDFHEYCYSDLFWFCTPYHSSNGIIDGLLLTAVTFGCFAITLLFVCVGG